MTRSLALLLGCIVATATLVAQENGRASTFEAASVKPADVQSGQQFLSTPGIALPGGRWSARNATVSQLLQTLYDVREEQIIGGPSWLDMSRFVVNAKAADAATTPEQLVDMAKQLLAERFKLRLHIEQRPFDVHVMVLARRDGRLGPGLRPTTCEMRPADGQPADGGALKAVDARPRCGSFTRSVVDGVSQFHFYGHTLHTQLTLHRVEALLRTPVVDRSGLTGTFDIDLDYAPDAFVWRPPVSAAATPAGPSLLVAMEEQLGLKFVRRRELLDVLVIDSVEPPTPD